VGSGVEDAQGVSMVGMQPTSVYAGEQREWEAREWRAQKV
jgi:hypothetical protein